MLWHHAREEAKQNTWKSVIIFLTATGVKAVKWDREKSLMSSTITTPVTECGSSSSIHTSNNIMPAFDSSSRLASLGLNPPGRDSTTRRPSWLKPGSGRKMLQRENHCFHVDCMKLMYQYPCASFLQAIRLPKHGHTTSNSFVYVHYETGKQILRTIHRSEIQ